MPNPTAKYQLQLLGKCVECGKIEPFMAKIATAPGNPIEGLAELLSNYHCQTHRQVTEAELLALEAEGLQ